LIAYVKGGCHASYSTVRKFLRDLVALTISRGQLANIIAKVSEALEQPYEQLLLGLPDQGRLNVDETGHKKNRLRQWVWCFRAGLYYYSVKPPCVFESKTRPCSRKARVFQGQLHAHCSQDRSLVGTFSQLIIFGGQLLPQLLGGQL
jgi:Transposase IS66 family